MQRNTLEAKLQQYAGNFHPVVTFNPEQDRLLLMNFTESNKDINEEILLDINAFSRYIDVALQQHNSKYGIGGYNEHRTIYSRSNVFDAAGANEEPRRLHLGVDIWGKTGTPVFAPLDGVVHSFAFNNRFGDYGATIILQHQLADEVFYILYGHLSVADLSKVTVGKNVCRGEIIGHFGEPTENGGWPPHLHIQLIKNLQNNVGDYPGVCRYSERGSYLENCPDPDLILGMMSFAEIYQK